jgi:hypothetical protein
VTHADTPVLCPCAEEEDAARSLLEMLDPEQLESAVICAVAPPDFVMMNAPTVPENATPPDLVGMMRSRPNPMTDEEKQAVRFDRAAPRGLAASALTSAQREVLSALINVYVDRLPEPLALVERNRIDVDAVYFAWAGETVRRRGHYYRLQGPSFLVEYDCTQDDANHVHAVWRDVARDFGLDVLRSHVSAGHS